MLLDDAFAQLDSVHAAEFAQNGLWQDIRADARVQIFQRLVQYVFDVVQNQDQTPSLPKSRPELRIM